jgi:NAD(P)-dependent dehydrogenase (short-subunit alcohol dehydrogenase family)
MEPNGGALVTGAGRGIGRAVAIELARRGFDVVATMRETSHGAGLADEAGAGAHITVERLDVNDESTMRMPAGLRVLVNNAGVESDNLPVEVMPADAWRTIYETNVFGLVAVTRHAIPALRDSGGGVICNVTSSSILAPVPFYAPYRSSKAAVSAIGESLRAELAPFGIRVLEIMPGPIDTDMLANSDRAPEAVEWPDYAAMAQRYYEGRRNIEGSVTSTGDAAHAIVSAILDDAAPLRVGCDPLASGMIEMWRGTSDEALMTAMLPAWLGDRSGA